MELEKRKHQRIASLNLLHIEVYQDGGLIKQGSGRTLNISESGILLDIRFPFETDKVTIKLSIGLKEDLLEIIGIPVRYTEKSKGVFHVGIMFNEIDNDATRNILRGYIEAFQDVKSDLCGGK